MEMTGGTPRISCLVLTPYNCSGDVIVIFLLLFQISLYTVQRERVMYVWK